MSKQKNRRANKRIDRTHLLERGLAIAPAHRLRAHGVHIERVRLVCAELLDSLEQALPVDVPPAVQLSAHRREALGERAVHKDLRGLHHPRSEREIRRRIALRLGVRHFLRRDVRRAGPERAAVRRDTLRVRVRHSELARQ